MKGAIFFLAALAVAAALPTDNDGIDDAKNTIATLLQSGKSQNACKDLAKATIKEIQDAAKTANDIMKNLDTGASCKNSGQTEVDTAKKALAGAIAEEKKANDASAKACNAKVTFASKPLSSLTSGKCDTFFTDTNFVNAKKACDDAKKAANRAGGAKNSAEKGVKDAKEAAAKEKNTCMCNAKKKHAEAAKSVEKVHSDENKKAWKKAHHMICVLDDVKPCPDVSLPAVNLPSLAAGVTCEKTTSGGSQTTTKPAETKLGR